MAGATGRHEALSLQCAEGRHGLCVAAGHTGELHGAGELRPAGNASIMWPAMHAGARAPALVRPSAAKAAGARRRPEAETKGMVSGGEGKGRGGD